jgi:hypothetical protein
MSSNLPRGAHCQGEAPHRQASVTLGLHPAAMTRDGEALLLRSVVYDVGSRPPGTVGHDMRPVEQNFGYGPQAGELISASYRRRLGTHEDPSRDAGQAKPLRAGVRQVARERQKLALMPRSTRCSDSVSLQKHLHRPGRLAGMPALDPMRSFPCVPGAAKKLTSSASCRRVHDRPA